MKIGEKVGENPAYNDLFSKLSDAFESKGARDKLDELMQNYLGKSLIRKNA